MACRGCSSDGCQCSIVGDGEGLEVTGSGTPITDPYRPTLNLADKLASETVDDATPYVLDPHVPALRSNGSVRMVPYPGTYTPAEIDAAIAAGGGGGGAGSGYSASFVFDDTGDSTAVDGIDGKLTIDSYDPDIGYTSSIYVSLLDAEGNDLTEWYKSFTRNASDSSTLTSEKRGLVRVSLASNPAVYFEGWLIYVSDQTTYFSLDFGFSHHSGVSPFVTGDEVLVSILPNPDWYQEQNVHTSATLNLDIYYVGWLITIDSASAVTVNLPTQASVPEWRYGMKLEFYNIGAGVATIVPAGGVTIVGADLSMNQYEHRTLFRTYQDDVWYCWASAPTDYVPLTQPINTQTGTTYGFVLADSGKLVTLSNASPVTATVPTNASVAFPIGTHIDLAALGAGTVSIAAAGGVTINSLGGLLDIAGQYGAATLIKTGTDTWLLTGALA